MTPSADYAQIAEARLAIRNENLLDQNRFNGKLIQEAEQRQRNHRYWSALMDEIIRDPTLTREEMAERVSQLGRKRTALAVEQRQARLGILYVAPGLAALVVARMMGLPNYVIERWCHAGLIKHRRTGKTLYAKYIILREDMEAFLRSNPTVYDYKQIKYKPWRSIAEVVWRSRGLVTARDLATHLGVPLHTIKWHTAHGCLPYIKGWKKRHYYDVRVIANLPLFNKPACQRHKKTWCHCE